MGWKSAGPGKFEFVGELSQWMREIEAWYGEDSRAGLRVEFHDYLLTIAMVYGLLAASEWGRDPRNAAKIEKLDAFAPHTDAQGNHQLPVFDLLDYLAESIDHATRMSWSAVAREKVRRIIEVGEW